MTASSRTQQASIDPLPSGAAQLNHIGDGLSICFQTPRVCCQTRRRLNRFLLICHHITDCDKGGEYSRPWFASASDWLWYAACYESADQPLPSSSAFPQCISGLNFEESLIAVVMLMMPGTSDLTKTSDRV